MCPMSSAPGDRPETVQETAADEPAPQQSAPQPPSRGASHYAKGTAANMVRSMAVILAIVLGFYFVAGRGNTRTPESLDVPGSAQHHAQQAGEAFAYPERLPDGWIATTVRYETADDVMTWNAGYTTPDEEHVSIRQAVDPSTSWITAQTNGGSATGTLTTEDGRDWVTRERDGQVQRSLVHDPDGSGELTTVITGTGSWDQLEAFADRLVEADTGKGASPAS